MPPVSRASLHQRALLWRVPSSGPRTDADGELILTDDEPTEIRCRWESQLVEAVSSALAGGNTVAYQAVAVVDRDVPVGSLLFNGSEDDYFGTGTAGPEETNEMYQVVSFDRIPDVKGRSFRRVCGLARFKDRMPGS